MKRYLYPAILVATVLFGGSLAYSIWHISSQTAEYFVGSGKTFYTQKKYPEAIIQFLNALQKDARNRDARYLLADSYLAQRSPDEAVKQLNTLLEYYPDDVEGKLKLANIYLAAGHRNPNFVHQAQTIAESILAKDPKNVQALVLKGNALVGLADYGSARGLFEEALSLEPKDPTLYVNMGTIEAVQNNPDAEKNFLKARELDPKNLGALLSLANFYRSTGRADQAEALYKEALATNPADPGIYLQAVMFYTQMDRLDQAEKVLRDAFGKGSEPAPLLMLSSLYWGKNRLSDAKRVLLELKDKFPQNLQVATGLAQFYLQDDPAQARKEVDQILKTDPKEPVGYLLLGELQFYAGQYGEAEATLNKEPALNSKIPAVQLFLGRIAALKGQTDQAQDHFKKALSLNTNYVPARLGLAEVFQSKGQIADARVEVDKVLEAQPGLVRALLLKSVLDTTEGHYADAEKVLTALSREHPDDPEIAYRLGLYYKQRGATADAEKNLLRALSLQPGAGDVLRSVAELYAGQMKTDQAIQTINSTVPNDRKQAFHYELMGLVYSRTGKLQEAETAFKQALQKEPERITTNELLALQYAQSDRLDDALQKISDILRKDPARPATYELRGIIYLKQGKIDAAKQAYNQALALDATSFVAANNLASIMAEEGRDLDVAMKWAQVARRKQPNSPEAADTLGWIQHKLGSNIQAADQLRFSTSESTNPVYQYHLGMIYKDLKDLPKAQTALKKAVGSKDNFKDKSLAESALKEITAK